MLRKGDYEEKDYGLSKRIDILRVGRDNSRKSSEGSLHRNTRSQSPVLTRPQESRYKQNPSMKLMKNVTLDTPQMMNSSNPTNI